MASSTYYASHPLSMDQQQNQHLLSSPDPASQLSSAQSSPRPLHIDTSMDSSREYKRQSLVDFDGLRKAHEEDAVR